jgi:hypothetical protein
MNASERAAWEAHFGDQWEKMHFARQGNDPAAWQHSALKLLAVVRLIGPAVHVAHLRIVALGKARNLAAVRRFTRDSRIMASLVVPARWPWNVTKALFLAKGARHRGWCSGTEDP